MVGKIHFRQRIPAFVEGVMPVAFTVDSIAELLRHPEVARWRDIRPDFSQFMQTEVNGHTALMAVFGENAVWYVVGMLEGSVDLPVWHAPQEG